MSQAKRARRASFRAAVFERDAYTCQRCGLTAPPSRAVDMLDAHHIVSRDVAPEGGYVPDNGVTLCNARCHREVEAGASYGL